MKIRVISEFYDKYHTSVLFKVGAVVDFEDERAKDIISKRLGEPYVDEKAEKPAETAEVKPEPAKEEKHAEPEKKKAGRPSKAKENEEKTEE